MAKYISLDTYSVRQAVLPYAETKNNPLISDNNDLEAICKNPAFRQAVLCASESLYRSMNAYMEGAIKDSRKKRQVELSLSQYWMRMSSRATPFGLFSYVSLASFAPVSKNKESLRAKIDADYEWIWFLSKDLETFGFQELSFVANGIITDHITSYTLPYIPGAASNVPVELKKTDTISYLIDKCSLGQYTYVELLQEIQDINPSVNVHVFDETIKDLLAKDFLISELRPNLSSPHLVKELLHRLDGKSMFGVVVKQLKTIVKQMENISNNIFDVDTEQHLVNLIWSMRALKDTPHVIKTDLINECHSDVLKQNDLRDLVEFANFFIEAVAYTQNTFTIYDEYKDSFLNKYGEYRLIPLSKMLDEKKGIGVPFGFKERRIKRKGEKKYPLEPPSDFLGYAHTKYREALQNGNAIQIDDLIDTIGSHSEKGVSPKSFELFFKIAHDENGKQVFVCNKDYGSVGVGKSLGRFSNDWMEAIAAINKWNNCVCPDDEIIECDLMYLPQRVHLGNVATSPNVRAYRLEYYQYSTKSSIPISDIFVGIKDDRFFLYSKSLKKRIRINTSNLLYYYGDCPEIRFLKEIQMDGTIRWNTIFFEKLNSYDYVPEIRYKSIIVRPESWIIKPPRNLLGFEEFDKWFLSQFKHLNGKNLAISFADNELKINVENKNSRYLIYKHCLHEDSVILVKTYQCISLPKATEVVIPFILESNSNYQNDTSIHFQDDIRNGDHESLLTLGGNWLSFEIYGCYDSEEYLSTELPRLIHSMQDRGVVTSFYYLQYANPIYHIRLRLYKTDILQNVALIVEGLNQHVLSQWIESFKICPYDRELERYGGLDGMRIAEKIFCIDSKCSLFLIQKYPSEEREKYFVLSVLDYMQMWNWDYTTQLKWLESNTLMGAYNHEWREARSTYYKSYSEKDKSYLPDELYANRMNAINEYRCCNIVSSELQSRILSALLHMSFNRIFGMNRPQEQRLMVFAKKLLCEIIARMGSDIKEES